LYVLLPGNGHNAPVQSYKYTAVPFFQTLTLNSGSYLQ
jgi:hypothetical protein